MSSTVTDLDRRFMAACIRLSRRHLGRTGTNPSVGTLIVADEGKGPIIVGHGVTALGGRPHAEPVALGEAGERARGATAYVTLEPCAHHGRTPPCAEALVRAGVARVVVAATDPDDRVSGRGYEILRSAGIEVVPGVLADEARSVLSSYLTRSEKKRVEVTLKLAVSADGMIGRADAGQVPITGDVARAQSHVLRAEMDAILIGIGTALEDNPQLTCRLPGLSQRSPLRVVLDRHARLPLTSRLMQSVSDAPLAIATTMPRTPSAQLLEGAGARLIACEEHDGRIALPELLDDLAAQGVSSLLVEGGAAVAKAFLDEALADRVILFESDVVVGANGIAAPFTRANLSADYAASGEWLFGADRCNEFVRRS
ncbi:bifunctional diaminohydroxyphosphoribosylaminopyrimidine deaminase/5-amino-6-(5-phosphoribosylamino)uracil reductase RibD [Oricola sp.]|uniref:bifunctional diaminohydroxyphosphoribosylaminopyrimidine deaminase/5-amino-6-(5-phosphoribosylamino)uracil reductase RibD n=1 Tax=Oricola sp. TaxID=1979950 RepID=UPI0025EF217F|nr:bifunctional diaminohydroxyphosphoribosylaminopyrimidine deaminase/5-amino-6-(5-phosphoribosylamino)uracil reductase RibD [Oricola sp.]MCI5077107.1 bifunctional diaminohydroxyphosphoribosylaminopyrimidine deaminase/5-amino-6-(5-phosphoribosylamino)uracil reductase RibD [Oricola sp.]